MSIELVMSSSHLILCHPLLLLPSIFPSIRIFPNESVLCIRWPKYWSFSFSISSFQWIFRTGFLYDWLIGSPCSPRDSQESSPAPQFKDINSLALSLLYGPTLTSIHDYWKKHSFDYMNLCWQSDVFAFEYAKFVIAFVPRNKYLLILWLQSSSEKLKSFFAFFLTMLLAKYSLFLFQLFQ